MRVDLVGLGLAITLLSTSLAHGQVIIDVSKVRAWSPAALH